MNEIMLKLLDKCSNNKVNSPYIYNGCPVPRVTAIISRCINNDGLLYWANSLGFKHQSYKQTLDKASSIGTQCHKAIDEYLDGVDEYLDGKIKLMPESNIDMPSICNEAKMAYSSYHKWLYDVASNASVEIIFHEKQLACPYFGGTLDGLYKINGKIYLVDYKTSNHISYNYCLQLAAYRYMLRTIMGIDVDGCIVLQLSKSHAEYSEYVLDLRDNQEHINFINLCENTFLSLVYAYHNTMGVESMFNKLKWRS